MFKTDFLKDLVRGVEVEQASDPLRVDVSRDGVVHVSSADLLGNEDAKRQIDAMKRIAERTTQGEFVKNTITE